MHCISNSSLELNPSNASNSPGKKTVLLSSVRWLSSIGRDDHRRVHPRERSCARPVSENCLEYSLRRRSNTPSIPAARPDQISPSSRVLEAALAAVPAFGSSHPRCRPPTCPPSAFLEDPGAHDGGHRLRSCWTFNPLTSSFSPLHPIRTCCSLYSHSRESSSNSIHRKEGTHAPLLCPGGALRGKSGPYPFSKPESPSPPSKSSSVLSSTQGLGTPSSMLVLHTSPSSELWTGLRHPCVQYASA
ncbi:hypothetical protein C8Q73DRAFT_98507 [Cubamyces lactineus]|nr:hypothetical protein C8Q73DRAFT_98507 [Cubamyces lactineus]